MIDITSLKKLDNTAKKFASNLNAGDVFYLQGDLGSGKTTFTQLLLKHCHFSGRVKSPTYAIYETYDLMDFTVIHMDLYRLASPEELYYLAIDEIFTPDNVVLIEWPDKGQGVLPTPSTILTFELQNTQKRLLTIEIT